jgi:hypothetical protein
MIIAVEGMANVVIVVRTARLTAIAPALPNRPEKSAMYHRPADSCGTFYWV